MASDMEAIFRFHLMKCKSRITKKACFKNFG